MFGEQGGGVAQPGPHWMTSGFGTIFVTFDDLGQYAGMRAHPPGLGSLVELCRRNLTIQSTGSAIGNQGRAGRLEAGQFGGLEIDPHRHGW